MAYELSNGYVTDDVTWPWKVKLVTPIRLERNISKTAWARNFKFGRQLCSLYWECRAGAQINFPESGRGLRHVTPTIFGSTVGYPSDSLASCYYFIKRNNSEADYRARNSWIITLGTCTTVSRWNVMIVISSYRYHYTVFHGLIYVICSRVVMGTVVMATKCSDAAHRKITSASAAPSSALSASECIRVTGT